MNDTAQSVAWHHARFRVPADWEITSYAIERREGRLEFSSRHGFQGLLSWESCKGAPDPETLMATFLTHVSRKAGSPRAITPGDLHTQRAGLFLLGYHDTDQPCQAIAHLPEEEKILRWVFASSPLPHVHETYVPILESFEPNHGAILDYAVFGLRFRLPANYSLEQMTVLPASVTLMFESDQKARATFRRWGLPELLLNGRSLGDFYTAFLRSQIIFPATPQAIRIADMDAVIAGYEQRGEHHMDRFMGRYWRTGEARLWYARREKRLYAFEQIGPPNTPLLDFTEVFPQWLETQSKSKSSSKSNETRSIT